jgi:hypothetical protein
MIDRDRLRFAMLADGSIECIRNRTARHAVRHLYNRTPATPLIDDSQGPKRSAIDQRIVNEVHAPALMRTARSGRDTAMKARVLATAHPMSQLQSIEPI